MDFDDLTIAANVSVQHALLRRMTKGVRFKKRRYSFPINF